MSETLSATAPLTKNFFGATMGYFALALGACVAGIFGGFYFLPPSLIVQPAFLLVMVLASLVLVFTIRRWANSNLGYLFLILFATIFGVTLIPLLSYAALTLGAPVIGKALLATVAMYGALALYGATTTRDLSGLGGFLMASLLGMIAVSLITLVLYLFGVSAWSNGMELVFSGFGILVFAGYTMYDFQMIRRLSGQITPIEAAVKLFLDFILLFEYILRFMLARRN